MPRQPRLTDICRRCERSWANHRNDDCPLPNGGWCNGGYLPPIELEPPPVVRPLPNTPQFHALAEGLHILAQKLYKESGRKHVLKSVTVDAEFLSGIGLTEGCEIQTSVGPVKVVSSTVNSFSGIDRGVAPPLQWSAPMVYQGEPPRPVAQDVVVIDDAYNFSVQATASEMRGHRAEQANRARSRR